MNTVSTSIPIVEAGNAATDIAQNPFEGGCHIHVNRPAEPAISVRWEITRFPVDGLIFLHGILQRANPAWVGAARLDVSLSQGDRVYHSSTVVRDGETSRWGASLVNDGDPFLLTLTLTAFDTASYGNGLFLLGPVRVEKPVFESTPVLFDLEGVARRFSRPTHRTLTSANQGGLMNRLVPMLSTVFIAERIDRRPQVLWGPNEHCAAAFHDIFHVGEGGVQAAPLGPLGADHRIVVGYGDEGKIALQQSALEANILVHTITPLVVEPDIPHAHVDLRPVFKRFRLAAPIRRMLAAFDDTDFSRTVALHIRRPYPGGAFADLETSKFRLGIDVFKDLVRDLQTSLPWIEHVLVCTNSLEAEAEMKDAFGSFVMTFNKSTTDNTREPAAVQEAMVDMILMSRCPLLFSQETTSFGHFAHVVGANTMVAVTSNTDEKSYEFWMFSDGRHVGSTRCGRGDAAGLRELAVAWAPFQSDEPIRPAVSDI